MVGKLGRRHYCILPILAQQQQIDEGNPGRWIIWAGRTRAADILRRFRPIALCGRDLGEGEQSDDIVWLPCEEIGK